MSRWKPDDLTERLLGRYIPEPMSGCWLWEGKLTDGYGIIMSDGHALLAHRISYEIHRGPIPDGLYVLHRCDVRSCINPDHLFLGTHEINMADMKKKGRADRTKKACGERNGSARLTAVIVGDLRGGKYVDCSDTSIARQLGVSRSTVTKARTGQTWKQI